MRAGRYAAFREALSSEGGGGGRINSDGDEVDMVCLELSGEEII